MTIITLINSETPYNFNVLADWSTAAIRTQLTPYQHVKNQGENPVSYSITDENSFQNWLKYASSFSDQEINAHAYVPDVVVSDFQITTETINEEQYQRIKANVTSSTEDGVYIDLNSIKCIEIKGIGKFEGNPENTGLLIHDTSLSLGTINTNFTQGNPLKILLVTDVGNSVNKFVLNPELRYLQAVNVNLNNPINIPEHSDQIIVDIINKGTNNIDLNINREKYNITLNTDYTTQISINLLKSPLSSDADYKEIKLRSSIIELGSEIRNNLESVIITGSGKIRRLDINKSKLSEIPDFSSFMDFRESLSLQQFVINLSDNLFTNASYDNALSWVNNVPNAPSGAGILLSSNPTSADGTSFKSILESKGYQVII